MIVELDAGNSSIKWRQLHDDGRLGSTGSCSLERFADGQWADVPRDQGTSAQLAEVWWVSVLGDQENRQLEVLAAARCNKVRRVTSAVSQATDHGLLRNGYRQPERLGADRWLAMIAALHRRPGPLLVVDSGSALTLDVVDGSGQHLGGYILPGLELAVSSLGRGTRLVQVDWRDTADLVPVQAPPGTDTQSAVVNGLLRMHADLVINCATRHQVLSLVLTGGNGAALLPHLGGALAGRIECVPTLVLDGLGVVRGA